MEHSGKRREEKIFCNNMKINEYLPSAKDHLGSLRMTWDTGINPLGCAKIPDKIQARETREPA